MRIYPTKAILLYGRFPLFKDFLYRNTINNLNEAKILQPVWKEPKMYLLSTYIVPATGRHFQIHLI